MTYEKKIYKQTYCVFKQIEFDFDPITTIVSKSGSIYQYTDKGVYRKSNHWGRVANCKWYVEGVVNYKNQDYYTGFALWEDFHNLNSEAVCYKILISDSQDKVMIRKSFSDNNCLFTINEALKRKKEVETILKSPRYIDYYKNPGLAKIKIIEALLTTKTSLSKIKTNIKNSK